MAARYTRSDGSFWCRTHKRMATHLLVRDGELSPKHVCDPALGGITLPCDAVDIEPGLARRLNEAWRG